MSSKRVRGFLDQHKIPYETVRWSKDVPLAEFTREWDVPSQGLIQSTIVRADDRWVMLVEPKGQSARWEDWRKLLGCKSLRVATDAELEDLFSDDDYDYEHIPATGNLFDMDVFIDDRLSIQQEIMFDSGAKHELIRMSYKDYTKWVKPKLFHIH